VVTTMVPCSDPDSSQSECDSSVMLHCNFVKFGPIICYDLAAEKEMKVACKCQCVSTVKVISHLHSCRST
jgi:hypothetical protein